jgi:putative transposase
VRMDHGTQYTSEEFRNEVKHWGMELSYGYVKEPQTNGVVERFNRTLKEQVIRGRVWRSVEELRAAERSFVEAYNEKWLLEKNGYRSPKEVRRKAVEQLAA